MLHCLARLYGIAIQGVTKGATERNTGCYIFHSAWKPRPALRWIIPPKIASNLECKPNALMATIPKDGPLASARAFGESVSDWKFACAAFGRGGAGSDTSAELWSGGPFVGRHIDRTTACKGRASNVRITRPSSRQRAFTGCGRSSTRMCLKPHFPRSILSAEVVVQLVRVLCLCRNQLRFNNTRL